MSNLDHCFTHVQGHAEAEVGHDSGQAEGTLVQVEQARLSLCKLSNALIMTEL